MIAMRASARRIVGLNRTRIAETDMSALRPEQWLGLPVGYGHQGSKRCRFLAFEKVRELIIARRCRRRGICDGPRFGQGRFLARQPCHDPVEARHVTICKFGSAGMIGRCRLRPA